jgi:hypothetical protein
LIVIIELDIPYLSIGFPNTIVNKKINLNDEIYFSVNYSKNPDEVYYSLICFYNFELVATNHFKYTIFRF